MVSFFILMLEKGYLLFTLNSFCAIVGIFVHFFLSPLCRCGSHCR